MFRSPLNTGVIYNGIGIRRIDSADDLALVPVVKKTEDAEAYANAIKYLGEMIETNLNFKGHLYRICEKVLLHDHDVRANDA